MSRLFQVLTHPVLAALAVAAAAGALLLAARGTAPGGAELAVASPLPGPSILAGLALYDELRCATCHAVQGAGGRVGRDLWRIGARRSRKWLAQFLAHPAGILPGVLMPPFRLPPSDLGLLVTYLGSLDLTHRPALPASREAAYGARDLVRTGCLACHRVGPEGAATGPDLTHVAARADTQALSRYLAEPLRHPVLAGDTGQGGVDEATPGRIVAYLSTLR